MARCRGHSSTITHLDWCSHSKYLQTTSAGCELLFYERDGTQVPHQSGMCLHTKLQRDNEGASRRCCDSLSMVRCKRHAERPVAWPGADHGLFERPKHCLNKTGRFDPIFSLSTVLASLRRGMAAPGQGWWLRNTFFCILQSVYCHKISIPIPQGGYQRVTKTVKNAFSMCVHQNGFYSENRNFTSFSRPWPALGRARSRTTHPLETKALTSFVVSCHYSSSVRWTCQG